MINNNVKNSKLFIALLFFISNSWALQSDHDAPIYISANTADISQKTGKGVYTGNVTVDQGTSHLTADIARTFSAKNNTLTKAIAEGNKQKQASFRTLPESDKPELNALADKITYIPGAHKIILEGHAKVTHGIDSYRAPLIEYDTKAQRVISRANPAGRTTIIIHPKKAEKTA